jgi:hypothetical protein
LVKSGEQHSIGIAKPAAAMAAPTRSRYADSRLSKNPSYISSPSASRLRAISIQSNTDMVRRPAMSSR